MIRVQRPEEPTGYHEHVRDKGRAWLDDAREGPTRRSKDRPESYWTQWDECPRRLAEGFLHRCGYTASYTPVHAGHVDHFVSWAECKRSDRHALAYEWSNLRWLDGRINQRKSKLDRRPGPEPLLDPFEIHDEWFELDLGRDLLVVTDNVPADQRARVHHTLSKLDLYEGRIVREQRRNALEDYRSGMSLSRLEEKDPLVARAIQRLMTTADEDLTPENLVIKHDLLTRRSQEP